MTMYDSGWFRMGVYGYRWVWIGVDGCGGVGGTEKRVFRDTGDRADHVLVLQYGRRNFLKYFL